MVIPVFAVYLLFDMNHIQAGIRSWCRTASAPTSTRASAEVDRLLSAFVRGQITVCLILGVFYAIGADGCAACPWGCWSASCIGFFNLIPFMSYLLGLPLALVLSWVDDQSPTRLVVVAAVFTFGQFVEGNFITPRVVGDSLGLHAVVIMLAVLVGGTLFGFIGMLVAVPMTAALSVFWNDLRDLYLRSDVLSARRGSAGPIARSRALVADDRGGHRRLPGLRRARGPRRGHDRRRGAELLRGLPGLLPAHGGLRPLPPGRDPVDQRHERLTPDSANRARTCS